jgi:beta-glucanase (GH16 family)
MKKSCLVAIFLATLGGSAHSQPVVNDASWALVFSDDFNGAAVDQTKWNDIWPWGPSNSTVSCNNQVVSNPIYAYRRSHVETQNAPWFPNCTVNSGVLKITSKQENFTGNCWSWPNNVFTITPYPFNYTTGMLISVSKFKMGYYEVRCKLPVPTVLHGTKGLGPNFWLWNGCTSDAGYTEIDVFEFAGEHYNGGVNHHTSNLHVQECNNTSTDPLCQANCPGDNNFYHESDYSNSANVGPPNTRDLGPIDFTQWHTFGVEWEEDRVTYYLDGSPYHTALIPAAALNYLDEMYIILDINHPSANFCDVNVDPAAQFPYHYEIDYIKVWQLNQNCSQPLNACTFNFNTYLPALYQSINIGGIGCINAIPANGNIDMRATNYIQIDGTFDIPVGADVFLDITPCQEQQY